MTEMNNNNQKKSLVVDGLKIGLSLVLGVVIGFVVNQFLMKGSSDLPKIMMSSDNKGNIALYPKKVDDVSNSWIIKIDDYAIEESEYTEGYKFFIENVPEEQKAQINENFIKQQYFDNLLNQYIILLEALKEGFLQDQRNVYLLNASIRQAIYTLYISQYLPKDKSAFIPTKIEINQFYQQNKEYLTKMGYNAEQIDVLAKQQLSQQKMQVWVSRFSEQIREKYKIERNKSFMQKEGISRFSPNMNLGK